MDKKTLILIDDSNLHYGFRSQQWELDYKRFYHWLHKEFCPIDIFFFGGIHSKKSFFDKYPNHTLSGFIKYKEQREAFFRRLRIFNYKVRTKPIASVYDRTSGEFKRKCNFDVEITIIAIDKIKQYDELVLCSGDGDFIKLAKYLKGQYKKVTIMAHKDRLNTELATTANRKIYFRNIKVEVEKKKELP